MESIPCHIKVHAQPHCTALCQDYVFELIQCCASFGMITFEFLQKHFEFEVAKDGMLLNEIEISAIIWVEQHD